jgi:hypothetical protein
MRTDPAMENASHRQRIASHRKRRPPRGVCCLHIMQMTQPNSHEQCQRVQVELEPHQAGPRVKIRTENFDAKLGWYTAGSLSLPLHQLPLLEQAVEEMRSRECSNRDSTRKIIPFPS